MLLNTAVKVFGFPNIYDIVSDIGHYIATGSLWNSSNLRESELHTTLH